MARQPRIDFPGAFHHVMNRGADHQDVFRTEADREIFLTLWKRAVSEFGIEIISFALMSNHYHAFVRSPDAQLSATLQFVGRAYTQIFNSRHGRDGALFRGRFHSVLIESETHLARVARYVELNPVSAGICSLDELAAYRWTSFQYSSGAIKTPDWLAGRHIQERFSSPLAYRKFVESAVPDVELERFYAKQPRIHAVLGSESFVKTIGSKYPDFTVPKTTDHVAPTPQQIESLISRLSGATSANIFSSSRPTHPARSAAVLLASSETDLPRFELAERYGFASDRSFLHAVNRARSAYDQGQIDCLCRAVMTALDR